MTAPRETRIQTSLLAAAEKRCLIWMARRLPARVNSDHLTALGALAMLGAGICYWIGRDQPLALVGVVVMLAINWFGDSLDGTLARVRHHERPRYGFYVDHVLDVLGILFLFAGLAAGGFMTPIVAAGFLLAYYLLTIEIALATHTVGTFRISYWKMGPTEMRILLAAGTLQLLRSADVALFGSRYLLFDVGGIVAIAGLLVTFIISAAKNTLTLYRVEPLPTSQTEHRLSMPAADHAPAAGQL
ncbi:MAG TPA: CDP-alcohol phosphatidyltransferase family protein [Vicinamibacterales bacterium]